MPKSHEPWIIVARKHPPTKHHPKGHTVFYYRVYDASVPGHYSGWRTTNCSTRGAARDFVRKIEAEGKLLIPGGAPGPTTFGKWSAGFWKWDGTYLTDRREFAGPESVSRRYVHDAERTLTTRLLPEWRNVLLTEISPGRIEQWSIKLRDRDGLSGKTVNSIVSVFRGMLKEAAREGRLSFDPAKPGIVRTLGHSKKARGRLTRDEVLALFAPEQAAAGAAWNGHLLYRAVNYVAAATGMRQGEILALRAEDVRADHIHVAHSWDHRYGLGPTKTHNVRDVPLPSKVREAVAPFLAMNVDGQRFVFSMDGGLRPCSGNRATSALYAALEAIGVTDRVERNVTFHSWRHWLNTTLRAAGIPDDLTRRVTGHESATMTDNYTDYLAEDFKAVAVVQAQVFG